MSAARNSFSTSENGTAGSATFIRLTSPVRIIFVAIVHPPPFRRGDDSRAGGEAPQAPTGLHYLGYTGEACPWQRTGGGCPFRNSHDSTREICIKNDPNADYRA